MEERCLQMAVECPDLLCLEVPEEVLAAAADDDVEPSEFLRNFLETGYSQWFLQKHGRQVPSRKELVDNATVLLWLRARRLNISRVLGRADAEWDKPFFSDEGLSYPR